MLRQLTTILLSLMMLSFAAHCQTDSTKLDSTAHLQISLITCGPGSQEVYEVFGHTAIRIIDSESHTDLAYNYGTFEFDKDFEWKFMRGKLLYCLSVYSYDNFVSEYVSLKRSVSEQVLLLNDNQKREIANYLNWNAQPQNRYYKYDFFFDNCATRIRDIFPSVVDSFEYASILPPGNLTYRDIINRYFVTRPWERIGVNILLGKKIDKQMSNDDIQFLPDYLSSATAGAKAGGRSFSTAVHEVIPSGQPPLQKGQGPLILTTTLALLTIGANSFKPTRRLGKALSGLILLVTGLLGCIILVMWFGTDHQACRDNLNLLWALPTNIVVAFTNPKGKPRYALVGIGLLVLSLAFHFMNVQALLLPELLPVIIVLAYIYTSIFLNSKKQTAI